MTSTPAPAPQKTEKGTRYVILRGDGAEQWTRVGTSTGTPDSAIKAAAQAEGAGTYVAVPARSWKPVKVTVSTETKVTLG